MDLLTQAGQAIIQAGPRDMLAGIGAIGAILAIFWGTTAIVMSDPSRAPVILTPAEKTTGRTSKHLQSICRLHERLYDSRPTQPPQTLFDFLGVGGDTSAWIRSGETFKAHDEIRLAWALKKKALMDHGHSTRLVDAVAGALLVSGVAEVYVDVVTPALEGASGRAKKLGALKGVCEGYFNKAE